MRMGSKGERECSPVDEEGGDVNARCRPRGTKIEWFPPPTLPHVGEGPKEAESRYRRIPPTPVCRDEVGLTSWLGKPLHQPAHLEQARVLRHPLEFRKLPCIRGCRLTGLVASSGCRPERGVKPLRERKGKGRGRVGVRGRRWRGLRFARNLDLSLKRWEDQGERR